jgi:hygromycin-B 7''-O-kinase
VSLLPDVLPEDWPALHGQPTAPWERALTVLGREWGRVGAWERMAGGEDSAVFAQDDAVVKLVPPFSARDAERETSVLSRVALPTACPRVLSVQRIDGWTAVLLSRLPGVPAAGVWSEVSPAERIDVLRALGETLAAVWETPLRPEDGDAANLHDRLVASAARHEGSGLPNVAAFVLARLPSPRPAPALLHLDLNDGNVLLERRAGRWRLSGVLDFVASRASYPPLDLVTPGVFFCRGVPAFLRALLEGAGLPRLEARELAAWHVLHPFSVLARDLAMAGLAPGPSPVESIERLWISR